MPPMYEETPATDATPAPEATPVTDATPAPEATSTPETAPVEAVAVEGEAAAPAKAEPVAEAEVGTYTDFTLPEGFELGGERLDASKEVFTKAGLNQEQAQMLVDHFTDMQTKETEALQDRLTAQANENIDRVKAMKVMNAGEGFEANMAIAREGISIAQKHIDRIFGDQAIQLSTHLEDTGIGNDPGLVQMGKIIGLMGAEDGFVAGGGHGPGPAKDRKDILYKN